MGAHRTRINAAQDRRQAQSRSAQIARKGFHRREHHMKPKLTPEQIEAAVDRAITSSALGAAGLAEPSEAGAAVAKPGTLFLSEGEDKYCTAALYGAPPAFEEARRRDPFLKAALVELSE
jgi:hypothetical protein